MDKFYVVDPSVHKDTLGRQVDLAAKKYPKAKLLLRPDIRLSDYWTILKEDIERK